MTTFEIRPRGPFSLAAAQDFAGGFPPGIGAGAVGETSIAMAFPIERTDSSAAVELSQRADGVVVGPTDAPADVLDQVHRQAARSRSLDHDGSGWPEVGRRDLTLAEVWRPYRMWAVVLLRNGLEPGARPSLRTHGAERHSL